MLIKEMEKNSFDFGSGPCYFVPGQQSSEEKQGQALWGEQSTQKSSGDC